MDSQKRHIHVALGKAEKEISSLMQYDDQLDEGREDEESPNLASGDGENLSNLVNELQQIVKQRIASEREAQDVAQSLSAISDETESLRERIEQSEAALIVTFLSEQERESVLALHKMAENGICPVCGTWQPELQAIAHRHAQSHQCLLCGSEEPNETNPELSTLRSQLAERIKSQQAFTHELRTINNKLEGIRRREDQIQTAVNKIRFAQPVVQLLERDLPATTREDLIELKKSLEQQEADLEAQIIIRKRELEKEYSDFKMSIYNRTTDLGEKYETYASQFLGLPCELSEKPDEGLITLSRFVPKFNDKARETPESCSEAQRFFLDIAFRMALIDLASEYEQQPGMFICETPENALDMSFIDNVVKMFKQFSDKGHSLLLSVNIQSNGIAGKLLKIVTPNERPSHVLNLLDIGQLSEVHKAALPKLRLEVRRAMK